MKKTVAIRISVIISLIAITAIMLTACGTKTFKINNITKIELADGTTGNRIEITDPDTIQALIQPFNENAFKKGVSAWNRAGWSYSLKFYQYDKLTTAIVVHGQEGSRISFNDYFYDVINGKINIETYKGLLPDAADIIDEEI